MKKQKLLFVGLLCALGPFVVLPFQASAEDTNDAGTSDASVTSDGDAGAMDGAEAGDADAGPPPLPAFDEQPFPEEKSPRPKDAEWTTAPILGLSDGGNARYACTAQRIREWMRFACKTDLAAVTMLGGNAPEDVLVRLAPMKEEWERVPPAGEVVLPVRRGDRRVIEWTGVEFGYKWSMAASSYATIDEHWLPEEEKPYVIMR